MPGELRTTVYSPTGAGWCVKGTEHVRGYLESNVTVKDLGLHRSMLLLPGEHFKQIRGKLKLKVGILARKKLTASAVRYMADAIIKTSLCYGEKLLAITQSCIDEVEIPLKGAFKKAAGLAKSIPNGILTGPRALGGMWKDWGTSARAAQAEMYMNELQDPVMWMYAEGAARRLAEQTGVSGGMYDGGNWHRLESAADTWLGDLMSWVVQNHMHWQLDTPAHGIPY